MISVLTFDSVSQATFGYTDASAIQGWLEHDDEAAATWLFEKYLPLVRHVCARRLPRSWLVEDSAQDTMSRAFQSLHRFDTSRCFSSWLTSIAANVCVDKLRRLYRNSTVLVEEVDAYVQALLDAPEEGANERIDAARELVESLQPDFRQVVELHYFDGLTAREVAVRTGLTQANVAIRLMRARQFLAARATVLGLF